jgi:polysaccharide deacetylase family protein (PEP-CTERM system associated)
MRLSNILTIDLEDWFQVSNLEGRISRKDWPNCEFRLMRNTERLLAMLGDAGARATFFVLGWNAQAYPSLVRQIAAAGHEIATHGYYHRLVYDMTPAQFREDLRRSIRAIEDAALVPVRGHRAASFSITESCLWALEVLAEEGIAYDSSMFPIRHDRYGVSRRWTEGRDIVTSSGSIVEVPITVCPVMGVNVPFAGGGYFRLLPYAVVRRLTRLTNRADKKVVFYFHPWEMDAGIPRLKLGLAKGFRSYFNIPANERKFAALLKDFSFQPIADALRSDDLPVRTLRQVAGEQWVLL